MERDDSVLSKILLENIGIDFRFGDYLGMRHFLFEVHGYVPNIDGYLECIHDALNPHIHELVKNGHVHFKFDESAFNDMPDKFFDTACFDITLTIGKKVDNDCFYSQDESGIVNGKKFVKFEAVLSDTTLLGLLSTINVSMSHELIHAYQDMSTMEKSGRRIGDTFDQERYGRIVKKYTFSRYEESRQIQELLWMLYNTEPVEINAFVGEIKADLKSNRDFISGSRRAEEAIKGTETYKRLALCWGILDNLKHITGPEEQSDVMNAYNDVFMTNVKSYNKFIKRLTARVERFSNQVMERASKIAYDIFAEKKPCIIK